jgi:phosphoglycolate phosphatase
VVPPPVLFDAVLFDLDGTLIATDRFWVQAARTGARRALGELGIERELPSAEEWMGVVGQPLERGFRALFPDLEDAARRRVQRACEEEEHALLRAGGAALMPGAREVLEALRAQGIRIGIASNCARSYLDHMLDALGLAALADEARCLDSPGIGDKADMLADLLATFGTRSAVMVGDRAGDRDAAWENGLPHVHCAFGFAARGEDVGAEGTIEDLGALPGLLRRRARWIEDALERAGVLRALARGGPLAVGITGPTAAGKSLFARDAARLLAARGRPATRASLDLFLRSHEDRAHGADEDHLGRAFDLEAAAVELLEPHARGLELGLRRDSPGPEGAPVAHAVDLAAGGVLVLDGPFLLDPRLRPRLERVLHLEVPDEIALRRVAGRDARGLGLEPLVRVRSGHLPAQRRFAQRYAPERLADLVLDASNPLGPAPAAPAA